MSMVNRSYSALAAEEAKACLGNLLSFVDAPDSYTEEMHKLGMLLGKLLSEKIPSTTPCLLVATAEDADYLGRGIYDCLKQAHPTKAAVFWNNHYTIPGGGSIAPVVHKFLEPGYESAEVLIIAKSVISGSCVVRTNLLELIDTLSPQKIFIVSPVMYRQSEEWLRQEFPCAISEKFEFMVFATDAERTESGEVKPGIGGEVYPLLGLADQPARFGFMPKLVQELAAL
ncbi:hypothetical protein BXU06_16010 [Aquaspirillum sp. LM1]|uniref:hypothetical protein n=1 Tax=Aquaspirillum sp. LM1 TaxID=1938604 RepID=UPI000983FEC5|nr:hypothetical protein [Aquaspirillum sp. LM1]AQR66381.1 hypothetical protein BXU06_16010 [Aquaspirillum sp. LM1]